MITLLPASQLSSLKAQVTTQLTRQWRARLPESLIRRAIEEAETVALSTGFPQLFLPELAAEKVRAVHQAVASDFIPRAA